MTTHTFKDRRELAAGRGRSLSLDASGYFRRLFQVLCLLPASPLCVYPSDCSRGTPQVFLTQTAPFSFILLAFSEMKKVPVKLTFSSKQKHLANINRDTRSAGFLSVTSFSTTEYLIVFFIKTNKIMERLWCSW